jgi:hypothetical protein
MDGTGACHIEREKPNITLSHFHSYVESRTKMIIVTIIMGYEH